MGNFKSFDELKRARFAAYKAMADGDVLGFLDQHTGFYPDLPTSSMNYYRMQKT